MAYQVLYRKYRPINFDEIIGQEYITNILKTAILQNKVAHAYLFCGPRGTGKTSTARVFAKAINCQNIENVIPCNQCSACHQFENSADIIEIDAASNNGVDEIRELRNNVKLVPSDFKYKIYIIDEVHMLSTGAFNALLKTLEEPPQHVIFILATTEPQKLPITVISRCQKFDFHKISAPIIENRLIEICKNENINLDSEVIQEISILCDGALRDALGLLEMFMNSKEKITISKFEELINVVSTIEIERLFTLINENRIKDIVDFLEKIEIRGIDFTSFANQLILILKRKAILLKQNQQKYNVNFNDIKTLVFNINKILYENRTMISPYLLLEMEILSILKNESTQKIAQTEPDDLKEIKLTSISEKDFDKEIEKKVLDKDAERKSLEELDQKIKARVNNCFVSASKECLKKNSQLWKEFVTKSETEKLNAAQYISDSVCVTASDEYLIIEIKSNSQTILFNKNVLRIEKAFFEQTSQKVLLVALNSSQWQIYKEEYINNKKNGVEYQKIEEIKEKPKVKKTVDKVALEIFDQTKIKIK